MEKTIGILTAIFFMLIGNSIAGVKYQREQSNGAGTIPGEVYAIFQNSCFDCHTKGGKKMAMSKVNFTDWESYSQDKKQKKSADIVRMLNKGAMPPKIYRQQHPDKIPSPEQIEVIKKWADSLSQK